MKFSDNWNFLIYKYAGSTLTDYWNMWHPADLSTASFYAVEVAAARSINVDGVGIDID